MALRKIVVISSTKPQPKEFHSEATTFGQLKDSLSEFGDLSKMRVVVKQTKATLELDEAQLPDTDITLFITPKQIKAGGIDIVAILESLRDKIYNAFNEAVEEAEGGEFGSEDDEDDYDELVAKTAGPRISEEDRDMLNELANLR